MPNLIRSVQSARMTFSGVWRHQRPLESRAGSPNDPSDGVQAVVDEVLMRSMADVLDGIRSDPYPVTAIPSNPSRLYSTLWGPSADDEIDLAWPGERIPEELLALWRHCRTARLYVDVDYGQWGLVLLDPVASSVRTAQARRNQPERFEADDVVLGSFLGDQELVVLAPAERGHRRVLIARPLDPRAHWPGVAQDLVSFLVAYRAASGDKYWERRSSGQT